MSSKYFPPRQFLIASAIALQLVFCRASKSGKQPFRIFINDECLTRQEKAELYAGFSESNAVIPSLRPSSSRNNNVFSNSMTDGAYIVYGESTGELSTSLSPSSSRNNNRGDQYEFHDGKRVLQQYEIPDGYGSSANMFDSWDTDQNQFTPSGKPTAMRTTETAHGEISAEWNGGYASPESSATRNNAPSLEPTSTITYKKYDGARYSSKASSSRAGKSWKVMCVSKSSKASAGDGVETAYDVIDQEQESSGFTEGEEEFQGEVVQEGQQEGQQEVEQEGQQEGQQEEQQAVQQDSDQAGLSDRDNSTISQKGTVLSRMCKALQNNEVFTTNNPLDVEFTYEVAVKQDFNVNEIIDSMDTRLAQDVGREMIDCNGIRQRMRVLQRNNEVQGIDPNPPDAVTGESCTYFTAEDGTLPANSECHVVHGLMTLYLNDTDDGTTAQNVQRYLEKLLNTEGYQFLDSIQGLEGVHYDYEGAPVANPEAGIDRAVGGTEESQSEQVRSSGWIAGVVLVSIGSIALVAFGLIFLRKKKKEKDQESFQMFEDDQSNADTHETLETREFFVDINVGSGRDEDGSIQAYEANARKLPKYLTNTEF
eukprot:CCRYP_004057-RA/>CCRYP_004057-RA protein AED:0.05 eAED:0.05 QI:264/1/1/1/0.5/0.33/3/343/594